MIKTIQVIPVPEELHGFEFNDGTIRMTLRPEILSIIVENGTYTFSRLRHEEAVAKLAQDPNRDGLVVTTPPNAHQNLQRMMAEAKLAAAASRLAA